MTTTGNIVTKTFGQNTITTWKFYFDVLTTEFGAINLAGRKLIKNWKNIQ